MVEVGDGEENGTEENEKRRETGDVEVTGGETKDPHEGGVPETWTRKNGVYKRTE